VPNELVEPEWSPSFPRLADLFNASDRTDPLNWFLQTGVAQALNGMDSVALHLERELQALDPDSWPVLRRKAAPYVHRPDKLGYHAQLFDLPNEAKAYIFLESLGARDVRLVPEGQEPTPDLRAHLATGKVAMEVKTIRESDQQKDYFTCPAAFRPAVRGQRELPEGLKRKILETLANAAVQLSVDPLAKRLIYLVVRLDFNLHGEAVVSDFVQANRPRDIEVYVHLLDRSSS
jgi:hypothetical protein